MGKAENETKIKKKSFQWVLTRPEIENSKKRGKKFKKLINNIIASLQAKIGWEMPGMRENKKNHSDEFLPDQE